MAIEVLEADDEDMPHVFEVASKAFGRDEPFWDTLFPNHWTDSGRSVGGERFKKTKNSDPNTTYLKAVDTASNEIVGMAKWDIYDNRVPDFNEPSKDQQNYYDNEDDREFAKDATRQFLKERHAAIRRTNGNVVSLDILAVDPAHQRKGVGAALVKWGTSRADDMGVEGVVESSPFGKGLYEKNGYVFVKDVVVQLPERWADRPKIRYAWLERPKRG